MTTTVEKLRGTLSRWAADETTKTGKVLHKFEFFPEGGGERLFIKVWKAKDGSNSAQDTSLSGKLVEFECNHNEQYGTRTLKGSIVAVGEGSVPSTSAASTTPVSSPSVSREDLLPTAVDSVHLTLSAAQTLLVDEFGYKEDAIEASTLVAVADMIGRTISASMPKKWNN